MENNFGNNGISERICVIVERYCDGNNSRFGEVIGESEANVRNYRNGKTPPKVKALVAIVKNFDISPEWLLLGTGAMVRGGEGGAPGSSAEAEALRAEVARLKDEKIKLLETIVSLQAQIMH